MLHNVKIRGFTVHALTGSKTYCYFSFTFVKPNSIWLLLVSLNCDSTIFMIFLAQFFNY